MSEETAFRAAIAADPTDRTTRLVFADWLADRGRDAEAAEVRLAASAVREIDLPALLDDYDWREVFGEGTGGNCDKSRVDACPPGAPVDLTPPTLADVAEVIAAANGENDGADWVGVFRLRDGRYLLATGGCDYTGWD